MDAAHEGTLHDGLNSGGSHTLSRLDEVGAVVRLRPRLTNPADEDVDPSEGDPVKEICPRSNNKVIIFFLIS